MFEHQRVLRRLRRARSFDPAHYVRHIYVAAALGRICGDVPDPWGEQHRTHIFQCGHALLSAQENANAGYTEIHMLSSDTDSLRAEQVLDIVPEKLLPALISINSGQTGVLQQLPGKSRMRDFDELLYWRTGAEACEGAGGGTDGPGCADIVTLQADGRRALAESGAYSGDFLRLFCTAHCIDAAALLDSEGHWLTRCHVVPLDRGVVEICGLETRPRWQGRGCARRLLRVLEGGERSVVLLTKAGNIPAQRAASAAGFILADRHRKALVH